MTDFKLTTNFKPTGDQPQAIKQLTDNLRNKISEQSLLGVTGSGKTFTIANIINNINKPALILAPNKTLAAQLYSEMKDFFPNNSVQYFVSYYDYYQPEAYVVSNDTYIEKDASINEHIEQLRLAATKSLFERKDTIIVATVSAIYGLGDPNCYSKMTVELKVDSEFPQRKLIRRLIDMQYTRNDVNFSRGTFRVRGGVIDIFPADEGANAVRVVLFGDDIEEIKIIDALTSNTIEKVDEFVIYPKTHYATPKERLDEIQEIIERDLELRLRELKNSGKILEASRLEQRTKYDLEMINEVGYCSGIENYSRYLSGRDPGAPPPTLFDYFPDRSLLFLDESHIMLPQINAMFHGDRSRKNNLVEYGFRLPSALDNRPLSFEEFEDMKPQTIYVSATPGEYELSNSSTVAEQIIRPTGILDPKIEIRSALTQVDDVLHEIRQATKNNNRVLITTLTKKMSENLSEFLKENNVLVKYLHSDIDTMERVEILRDLREGTIDVLVGINLLREGLDLPEVSLVAIFDADQTGFLRSKRSLIQTIGRAARNPNGRVIMYSEQMTPAMEEAISETNRRREIQEKYNKQHNITPKAINKSLINIVGGTEQKKANKTLSNPRSSPNEIKQLIKNKHNKMLEYAKELKFEEASKYRDEIKALKEELLKS